MKNVLEAKIPGIDDFTLSDLTNDSKICEMACHWKTSMKKEEIEQLLKDDEVKMKYDSFDGYL
jgi:hypothetical protein